MRIFFAVPNTPHQTCLPASAVWHMNLRCPLVDMGHELVDFRYDYSALNLHLDPTILAHRTFITDHRPLFGEELVRQVTLAHRERPLDLFFSYFYAAYVEPEAIREIKRLGIPTMNWYCNASYQFHLVAEIAPAYDYCLVPEKFRLDDYRRVGANPIYCQEAANPSFYHPYDVPQEFDVTFVGQKYGDRPAYLRALYDAGLNVRAWGPHWQDADKSPSWKRMARRIKWALVGPPRGLLPFPLEQCGPPLSDDALIAMYSRSKISLGFTTVAELPADGSPPIKQVRLRDFEATMSGAFYLVEYFEELTEFFTPDREIVCFADAAELVDKARYYLRHEQERECIRQAGLERARREHTWQHRLSTIFRALGLTE